MIVVDALIPCRNLLLPPSLPPSSISVCLCVFFLSEREKMGGRGKGRSRTQRKHFRDGRENVWKRSKSDPQQLEEQPGDISTGAGDKPTPTHWQPFETQNPAFDDYYKEQEVVASEEWDTFMGCLRKPLPAAFRINSSSQFCSEIRSQLENDFMISLQNEGTDGGEAEGIKPLHWYPENLAWQSSFSRMQLRKNQNLERFHQFLKQENEIGNITRQEAVSMVPPLFLDVRPDHFVLDMCAAPGSKTFQLLEMIHRATGTGSLPTGMVIANDLDVQRCNLLIHQTKRMCTANLIVTNHEAQHFPGCHTKKEHANVSETSINQLLFDRVLCDVPCSGDGTLRKAPDIWKKWSVGNGNGLHCLQIQIALRGLSLLKIGGKMVYSTCSMNPVENEAVVAEILRRCGESVELLDVSTELPKLVRRPGLKKWKIRDKGMWLASYKEVRKFRRTVIVPSMFPSGESYVDTADIDDKTVNAEVSDNGSDEISANISDVPGEDQTVQTDALVAEVSTLPLERCMRIVPHDQNTGAFFIAVFQKLTPLPASQLKAVKPHRQLNSSNNANNPEKLEDEVKDQSNGMEVDLTDVADEKFPEAIVDADVTDEHLLDVTTNSDLLDNETKETLAIDPSQSPKEPESLEAKATDEKGRGKRKLQSQGKWKGVDPVVFLESDAIVDGIRSFYGIKDDFPFKHHLITRNTDMRHMKRIYYVANSVKDVLELNFLVGQQLKITSIGLKMFERQASREGNDPNCAFRISSEGLPLLLPYMTKQILFASPVDFKHLLQDKIVKFGDFVGTEFGEKASNLKMGCCAVVLKKGDETVSDTSKLDSSTIAISCWRGRTNVAVMVTAIDCQELLERLLVRMETEMDSSLVGCKDEKVKMTDTKVKEETKIVTPA